MAVSREQKVTSLTRYVDALKQSNGIILADYSGLKVSEVEKLRRAVTPLGGRLLVVKNRVLKLALEETGTPLPDEYLTGPTMVGFCFDAIPPVAKVLMDATKEYSTFQLKGGLIGDSVLTIEQAKTIAFLPPRAILLGQVLGTINAPASRVASVIAGGIRQILNVVQAYVDKLEEAGGSVGLEPAAESA